MRYAPVQLLLVLMIAELGWATPVTLAGRGLQHLTFPGSIFATTPDLENASDSVALHRIVLDGPSSQPALKEKVRLLELDREYPEKQPSGSVVTTEPFFFRVPGASSPLFVGTALLLLAGMIKHGFQQS